MLVGCYPCLFKDRIGEVEEEEEVVVVEEEEDFINEAPRIHSIVAV